MDPSGWTHEAYSKHHGGAQEDCVNRVMACDGRAFDISGYGNPVSIR